MAEDAVVVPVEGITIIRNPFKHTNSILLDDSEGCIIVSVGEGFALSAVGSIGRRDLADSEHAAVPRPPLNESDVVLHVWIVWRLGVSEYRQGRNERKCNNEGVLHDETENNSL